MLFEKSTLSALPVCALFSSKYNSLVEYSWLFDEQYHQIKLEFWITFLCKMCFYYICLLYIAAIDQYKRKARPVP